MLRIDLPQEPYWLELPRARIRLRVRPLDAAVYFAARNRGIRRAAELARQAEDLTSAGARVQDCPDLKDPDTWAGYVEYLVAQAYGEMGVIDWEGIGDAEGNELAFTPALVPQLLRVHQVAEEFVALYTAPYQRLEAEKNASAPAPTGTSAAGTPTASAAATPTPPAAAANPATTATAAPTTNTSPRPRKGTSAGS
jgi:hypothetical protein